MLLTLIKKITIHFTSQHLFLTCDKPPSCRLISGAKKATFWPVAPKFHNHRKSLLVRPEFRIYFSGPGKLDKSISLYICQKLYTYIWIMRNNEEEKDVASVTPTFKTFNASSRPPLLLLRGTIHFSGYTSQLIFLDYKLFSTPSSSNMGPQPN